MLHRGRLSASRRAWNSNAWEWPHVRRGMQCTTSRFPPSSVARNKPTLRFSLILDMLPDALANSLLFDRKSNDHLTGILQNMRDPHLNRHFPGTLMGAVLGNASTFCLLPCALGNAESPESSQGANRRSAPCAVGNALLGNAQHASHPNCSCQKGGR